MTRVRAIYRAECVALCFPSSDSCTASDFRALGKPSEVHICALRLKKIFYLSECSHLLDDGSRLHLWPGKTRNTAGSGLGDEVEGCVTDISRDFYLHKRMFTTSNVCYLQPGKRSRKSMLVTLTTAGWPTYVHAVCSLAPGR